MIISIIIPWQRPRYLRQKPIGCGGNTQRAAAAQDWAAAAAAAAAATMAVKICGQRALPPSQRAVAALDHIIAHRWRDLVSPVFVCVCVCVTWCDVMWCDVNANVMCVCSRVSTIRRSTTTIFVRLFVRTCALSMTHLCHCTAGICMGIQYLEQTRSDTHCDVPESRSHIVCVSFSSGILDRLLWLSSDSFAVCVCVCMCHWRWMNAEECAIFSYKHERNTATDSDVDLCAMLASISRLKSVWILMLFMVLGMILLRWEVNIFCFFWLTFQISMIGQNMKATGNVVE